MARLSIVTWNVLHRIHGEKWSRDVVRKHPDEPARIARIAARVAGWVEVPGTVVCLQEVSGDQLAALAAPGLWSHRYARVPKWWRFWARPLRDASEHLVIAGQQLEPASALTFASDDGKGMIAVDLPGGVRIVNVHLTFGAAGEQQLKELAPSVRSPTVAVGDFNADRDAVARMLGAGFDLSDVAERATRVTGAKHKRGPSVDYIAVIGGRIERTELLDSEGLSDHHPLSAVIAI